MKKCKGLLSLLICISFISTGCGKTASANSVSTAQEKEVVVASTTEVKTPESVVEEKEDQTPDSTKEVDDTKTSNVEVSDNDTSSSVDETPDIKEDGKDTDDSLDETDVAVDNKDNKTGEDEPVAEETVVEIEKTTSGTEALTVEVVNSSPRGNVANVLTPVAGGTDVKGNGYVSIDVSNASEGYIVVTYKGANPNVKFQMTGSNNVKYTYKITNAPAVLPLAAGSGNYTMGCYEGLGGNQYAVVYTEAIPLTVNNAMGPFLYPNQYVNFNASSQVVAQAAVICSGCTTDLAAVEAVYHYVVKNFKYDYDKAASVTSGYVPVVDSILATKKGICFDYAAVMTSMLRSQNIPTKLEVGYAGDAYHAWISTYVKDVGWIDGIIKFDGKNWTLMDPTFASGSNSKDTKKFITTKSNYAVKYTY